MASEEKKFFVRPMGAEDLDRVQEIAAHCFTVPWTRQDMEKELQNEAAHYLVAETKEPDSEETVVAGYIGYWQVLDEGHVMNVAVEARFRGRGIGTGLVKAMIEDGTPRGILYWTLEVRVSNQPAIRVYEKEGFVSAGRRPGYYSEPKEDAYIYWRRDDE